MNTELEQIRIENEKLKAERDALLAAVRKLQEQLQKANAFSMGIVNHLQGTNR